MNEIILGCTIAKPVTTQEECDAYAAMAQAVNDHNAACAVGDVLWTIEDNEDCYKVSEGEAVIGIDIERLKNQEVAESKTALATYLAEHPLQWTDGKFYSVTSEKQSLLTSNLALYQISAAAGQPFKLTWNSTGDECVEWTYEDLASLALAIGAYVKPFVSHQQELELTIKACTTAEELEKIEISYS